LVPRLFTPGRSARRRLYPQSLRKPGESLDAETRNSGEMDKGTRDLDECSDGTPRAVQTVRYGQKNVRLEGKRLLP
jgi:hypothetical protein